MRRRRWRGATGAVAAAAALCVVATLPGQALARDTGTRDTDTARDTATDGAGDLPGYATADGAKKIKGTAGTGDGPDIGPGTYTDSIGRGEKKYYSVSLDAKSSAFLSAVAAPEPGSKVQPYGEGLRIKLETGDGSPCDGDAQPQFGSQGIAYPIAGYASRIIGAQDECQKAGPYHFSVERVGSPASDPARWPLEIRFMSEPGLKGSTPAAPGDNGADDEPPALITGTAKKKAHGGTGFNDAGAVSTGVWKDRVRPGETRFYRVPLDWGQRLNAAVELGSADSPGEYPETIFSGLGLTAYNPARGQFDKDDFGDYSPDKSAQAGVYTPVVDYGNRFADSGAEAPVAGWYYLAVTVSPKIAKYFSSTAPLTLRIDVKGAAMPGPDYAGDARAAGFGVSGDDKEQAAKGQSAAQAERSDTLTLVGYAGIGTGVVLILALALWTLTARRRTAVGAGAGAGAGAGVGAGPGAGAAASVAGPGTHSGTVPLWPQRQGGQEQVQGRGSGPEYGQQPPHGR